jgi:uncharacterized protein YajQ (UPF0234 family)
MASDSSFDVVSEINRPELVNAIDQVTRELTTRYDLKSTGSTITLEKDAIQLACDTEFTLKSVRELLIERAARRGLETKVFDFGKVEPAARGTVRQTARLREGIGQDLAKQITKSVRDKFPKLKAQIQGDAVRVSGPSRDMLQGAIKLLREEDYPVPLQFTNYR